MRARHVAAVLLAGALTLSATGCSQQQTGQALTPGVVAVRDAVERIAPPPRPALKSHQVHPRAVALIIEFEVTSRQQYERRYQSPIWPGGRSGVTWGIGYDGGHQTASTIRTDWHDHPSVERLAATSGITGPAARPLAASLADITIPWDHAVRVFENSTLARYHRMTRGAFPELDRTHDAAQGALVSVVYNRGPSMLGDSRREMRTIRDECLPASDHACIARELRAMCRLWRGTDLERGLCRRREAEARLAETPHV